MITFLGAKLGAVLKNFQPRLLVNWYLPNLQKQNVL